MFAPKKIQTIGIDISESSVKLMQLAKHKDGFLPSAYSHVHLPNSLIANHIITDPDKLASYIARAVHTAKYVDTRYVVASVPEAKSFVRVLKMPKMPESEIEGAIPWELEQDIPVPIDQVYFDWRLVKEEDDSNQVLVMATPKDYVDNLVQALKIAKLKPVALELEPLATARALIGPDDANQAVLIMDISTTASSLAVISGSGVLEYTSSVPVGGNHMTDAIAKNLGINQKEAEKMKVENGLMADSKKANVRQAMLPILDALLEEVRNVIKFHEDHSVLSPSVNKVVLCGGGANLKGLLEYITARTNVGAGRPIDRIVLGSPWINIGDAETIGKIALSSEDSLSYATAIGLALRGTNQ
jgi:type IV pilus assembly protein PilM